MAELADTPDLGSGGVPRAGSIPVIRSMQGKKQKHFLLLFYISLITMVEVPESMIHYPYIRILSRYAIREKVTAGGK